MNLIMGRRQTKRQEPQCGPLHHQQQQQQSQNKHTPPPPPPPPPPPCADDSWELQYCKWWGWNWVKKDRSEMNKYAAPSPCEGPTRDNLPPVRCPAMPIKRVDKNNNRFKDFCNCLFSPNRKTAESLQRLYSTPSNSLIYESLCCGNQERGLDSYTCMELRNRSNKNTPNKRSKDKICKCPQEQEKKEKRKKHCTCKDSISSLSNGCNCKEKEPPKKGCNCKESKVNAMRACNFKDSNSELPPQMCCNCKDSNNNLIKKCCECNETNCPKKCCCGCMEPSNVARKCCGCPPNPSNAVNCCGCPKKSEQVTCNCNKSPNATKKLDCPYQIKSEVKCIHCQTINNTVNDYVDCTNCFRDCKRTRNVQIQSKCNGNIGRKKQFVCRICKERKQELDESDKNARKRSINFDDFQSPEKPLFLRSYEDEEETERILRTTKPRQGNRLFMAIPYIKPFGNQPEMYQTSQTANFAFVQKGCTDCKWLQSPDNIPSASYQKCPPNCVCSKLSSSVNIQFPCGVCNKSVQCGSCRWFDNVARNSSYAQTAQTASGYAQTAQTASGYAQTASGYAQPEPKVRERSMPTHYCCPNCGTKPKPKPAQRKKSSLRAAELEEPKPLDFATEKPESPRPSSPERRSSPELLLSLPAFRDSEYAAETADTAETEERESLSRPRLARQKTRLSYPMYAKSRPFIEDAFKKNVNLHEKEPLSLEAAANILSKYYALKWESDLAQSSNEYGNSFLSDFIQVNDENSYLKRLQAKLERERLANKVLRSKLKKKSLDIESKSSSSTDSNEEEEIKRKNKRLLKALFNNVLDKSDDEVRPSKNRKKRQRNESRKENIKKLKNLANTNKEDSSEESSEDSLGLQIENFNYLFDRINKITNQSRFNVRKLKNTINSPEKFRTRDRKSYSRSSIREDDSYEEVKRRGKHDARIRNSYRRSESSSSSQELSETGRIRSKCETVDRIRKSNPNPKVKTKMKSKTKIQSKKRKEPYC